MHSGHTSESTWQNLDTASSCASHSARAADATALMVSSTLSSSSASESSQSSLPLPPPPPSSPFFLWPRSACASSEYLAAACSALPALSAPLRPLGISWAAHSCTPQVFSAHLPEAESQKGQPRFGL